VEGFLGFLGSDEGDIWAYGILGMEKGSPGVDGCTSILILIPVSLTQNTNVEKKGQASQTSSFATPN